MASDIVFENDWFTRHKGNFEKHLKPLIGRPARALEIGCNEGRATRWMLDNIFIHDEARIICIDIHKHKNFAANTNFSPKISHVTGLSRQELLKIDHDCFDFIYIDGSHEGVDVLEDAVLSFRLMKVGGIFGFDDYRWKDKDGIYTQRNGGVPKPAIDAFKRVYKHKLARLSWPLSYQAWFQKIAA